MHCDTQINQNRTSPQFFGVEDICDIGLTPWPNTGPNSGSHFGESQKMWSQWVTNEISKTKILTVTDAGMAQASGPSGTDKNWHHSQTT